MWHHHPAAAALAYGPDSLHHPHLLHPALHAAQVPVRAAPATFL